LFSLVAASDRDCERVVAIEPIPDTITFLRSNLELNDAADRVSVIAGAVADTSSPTISMRSPVAHSGGSRIALDGDIDVPVVRETQINEALEGTTGAILAKIDVEGMEPEVLAVLRRSGHYARISGMVVEVTEHTAATAKARFRSSCRSAAAGTRRTSPSATARTTRSGSRAR
jgi:FkbM family methyltransferase